MTKHAEKQKGLRSNEQKWGKKLWEAGWVGIPSLLLSHQARLGLEAADINIILHLVKHWWEAKKLPFPAKSSIAKSMRIHPSTVQRRIRAMEEQGLIRRIPQFSDSGGQMNNEYDLTGLVRRANELVKEELAAKKNRQQHDARRRKPGIRTKAETGNE